MLTAPTTKRVCVFFVETAKERGMDKVLLYVVMGTSQPVALLSTGEEQKKKRKKKNAAGAKRQNQRR